MPVMMPGRAIGRISISEMPSLPKKSRRYSAADGQRAEHQRDQRGARSATCSDSLMRLQHVRPREGDAEPAAG